MPGALLDIWQANSAGRYHHPSDTSGRPLDPDFQGAALVRADRAGEYRFLTVMPAPYKAGDISRERHIHFDIRGRNRRLMTQLFFPGEPNDRDNLYRALHSEALQRAVTAVPLGAAADGQARYRFDIRLAGE